MAPDAQPTAHESGGQPPGALRQRLTQGLPAREGAFWVAAALVVPRLVGPIFTVVLRRFLGPKASGLFDLAATPYRFLDNFRNFGTGPALVYERTISSSVADTAWTLNMIFAVVVTAIAMVLSSPIAAFYGRPHIAGIVRVLSIAYVFASAGSVHYFLLLRDLDYRKRSIPPLGQVIAGGILAILFAIWGFGVGALVGRELASVVAGTALLWIVYPYRPSPRLVLSLAWQLFRYGAWVGTGLTILYMSQNVDVFIGGHVIHRTKDIGFYTTAWSLAFIAAGVFSLAASSMVFPVLSRLQDDPASLRETLLTSIRQLGLVMFPLAALLATVAPVFVVPILGSQWVEYRSSFLVLSLLAVYAGNRTMLSIFIEGYKAIGKPWIAPVYNAIKLAVMLPAMDYGAHHGILGLALAYIPIQALEIPAALILARRVLHITPGAVWRSASTPILATLFMAAIVADMEIILLRNLRAGDTLTLLACSLVGVLVYVGTLYLLDRRILEEIRAVMAHGL